jgi:1-deoxy-D-xylulose-5-phosphate synthase
LTQGEDLAILSIGHVGNFCQEAIYELRREGASVAHYDMRFVKPLDEVLLHEVFTRFDKLITVEDGCVMGGMGSAILEFMAQHGYRADVKMLGIPDRLVEHGTLKELHAECGYDAAGIRDAVKEMVGQKVSVSTSFSIAG